MGDVINLGDRVEFSSTVDQLDNITRAINVTREMLTIFSPRDRIAVIGQVLAGACCEYGGRNACGTLARNQLGECFSEVSREIDKVFPPPGEVPFA
jgi:hypothetical protein